MNSANDKMIKGEGFNVAKTYIFLTPPPLNDENVNITTTKYTTKSRVPSAIHKFET